MPAYLGRGQIGICQRCGFKFKRVQLMEDAYTPHLLVCAECFDPDHPQKYAPPTRPEGMPPMRPAPENLPAPTAPVLTGEYIPEPLRDWGYVTAMIPESAASDFRHSQENNLLFMCTDAGFTGLNPGDQLWLIGASDTMVIMAGQDSSTNAPVMWRSSNGLDHTRVAGSSIWAASESIRGIAFGGTRWVAVGGSTTSKSATSDNDGVTWTERGSPTAGIPIGIAYLRDRYVTFDSGGRLYTSTNGVTWILRLASGLSGKQNFAAAVSGSRFVILVDGQVIYSDDGDTWVVGSDSPFTNTTSYLDAQNIGLAYGAGLWVATGNDSIAGKRIMTSTTGIGPWTSRTIPDTGFGAILSMHDVKYTGSRFITTAWTNMGVYHMILSSTNGITWTMNEPGFYSSSSKPAQAFVTNNALGCPV